MRMLGAGGLFGEIGLAFLCPKHFLLCYKPTLSVVVVALIEQVCASLAVGEQMRMPRLAAVPLTCLPIWLEGKVA